MIRPHIPLSACLSCILLAFSITFSVNLSAQPLNSVYKNPLVFGNNRITLISPTLFRLEYAEGGKFLDNPTMFAWSRDTLLKEFKVTQLGGNRYQIETSALRMVFDHDNFPFGLLNFEAFYKSGGKEKRFTIRNIHKNNLGGAVSTLDRVDKPIPLNDGLLSRDGWYIINDAGKEILVDNWIAQRDKGHVQDLYCFVYGDNYKEALCDLGRISGNVPMTRKYVHGVWYCRYWPYTSAEYLELVSGYREHDFPLDMMVFDMDWHTVDAKVGTGHASNRGWTGYTWNKELIPDPEGLIDKMLKENIYVSLNEHPHDGIRPNEDQYQAFMKAMGREANGETILFDASDRTYMENFLKYAHGPGWDMGIAFWWLDWQQDYLYPYVRGTNMNHLSWLNKLYYEDSSREGLRGAGYSRWAGWGDHRYPIQFSGDAHANWAMLAFEVELTATSGNAGCYYWAHDIGGFYEGDNPEMFARWTQFGALSAALRVHSQKAGKIDRRPWIWGEQATGSMRKAYHFRSQIMPYIYSSIWQTHKTMVPLSRAMYIDYGNDEESYNNPQQFMFGDLLLAAPITTAGEGENLVASQKVWFPKGKTLDSLNSPKAGQSEDTWYDFFDSTPYKGGTKAIVKKGIDEFPLFVKGGYLLPMQPYTERPASTPLTHLILKAWPGADGSDNSYTLYEDDGLTTDYLKGNYATTELIYKRTGNKILLTIAPTKGTYTGQPQNRSYTFELAGIKEIGEVSDISGKSELKNLKELNNQGRPNNRKKPNIHGVLGISGKPGNKKSKPEARFNKTTGIYTIEVGSRSIREPLVLEVREPCHRFVQVVN